MNCIRQRVSALHVVALLTLFVLTAAAILPLQAQSDTATKQAPKAASVTWEQYGYGATHVGYNPKEKTLSAANVSQLTQTWEFPTNAAVNIPTLTSGNTVFVDSTDGNLYALNASSGTLLWKFAGTLTRDGYGGGAQGMAISGKTIYVDCQIDEAGGGHAGVCALNASTGALLWSWAIYTTSSAPSNGPVVSGSVLVPGENDTNGLDGQGPGLSFIEVRSHRGRIKQRNTQKDHLEER